jgi:hypothetical protein
VVAGAVETFPVHRNTRVQLPDELLVGVVPLALGCESAERPDGDGERECQEQQARGEPQAAAGDAPYFLPPLPLPASAGGPPPWAFGGAPRSALGAFFACPGGSPWWCSPGRPSAFPCPCARDVGAPAVCFGARARSWPRAFPLALVGVPGDRLAVTGAAGAAAVTGT